MDYNAIDNINTINKNNLIIGIKIVTIVSYSAVMLYYVAHLNGNVSYIIDSLKDNNIFNMTQCLITNVCSSGILPFCNNCL